MAYVFSDVKTICQEAFYLLRQDASDITLENWISETPPITVSKCRLALPTAIHEVIDEYRWYAEPTEDNISAWPRGIRNSLVYCLARELAIPIAGRIEDMKTLDALYRDKIQQAKITDFEYGKSKITDEDIKMVFALITMTYVHGDGKNPSSIKDIVDRITVLKDAARREVLLAQEWNFAKIVIPCESAVDDTCDDGYPYLAPYPVRSLRVVTVGRTGGFRNEWKVEGGFIRAKYPISSIRYTRDVPDMSKWCASAKNAYIHRLAADVARTVMNNPQDAALQEQAYNLALENARLRDSRESSTPTDAWGMNYYAEQMMTGGDRRALDI